MTRIAWWVAAMAVVLASAACSEVGPVNLAEDKVAQPPPGILFGRASDRSLLNYLLDVSSHRQEYTDLFQGMGLDPAREWSKIDASMARLTDGLSTEAEDCTPDMCDSDDVPFRITDAYVYYDYVPMTAKGTTRTTHNAVFEGTVNMTRTGANGLMWSADIGSDNYGWSTSCTRSFNVSGPCSLGAGDVQFAGSHYAERNLMGWQTDHATSYTHIAMCTHETVERTETVPADPGLLDGGLLDNPTEDQPRWCVVRVWYWKDTLEIVSIQVLYCY